MSNKMLAVVVCALILGIMALSPPDKPSRREQVQSQMIAQAREEWERKNCVAIGEQYLCRDASGRIMPYASFKSAHPELFAEGNEQ